MLYEIMMSVKNFFARPELAEYGRFRIEDGKISLPHFLTGQYFLIEGSLFNDKVVYKMTDEGIEPAMKDETFVGWITPLSPPPGFIALCDEIIEWQKANGAQTETPYSSESFGGYSYSKATGANGGAYGWRDAFAPRLSIWRKM